MWEKGNQDPNTRARVVVLRWRVDDSSTRSVACGNFKAFMPSCWSKHVALREQVGLDETLISQRHVFEQP